MSKKTLQISPDDILLWILENKDNTEVMDKINWMTFPHTSKFKARQKTYKDIENGVSIGE